MKPTAIALGVRYGLSGHALQALKGYSMPAAAHWVQRFSLWGLGVPPAGVTITDDFGNPMDHAAARMALRVRPVQGLVDACRHAVAQPPEVRSVAHYDKLLQAPA